MIHDQTKQFEWEAMEFEHYEKSTDWYWALGIAIVTGCILSIITKNYLLAVLLFLGGIFIGYFANEKPASVHVEISDRGIKLNKDLYLYDSISSFWMYIDHKGHHRISLITARKVMPQRVLTLPDQDGPTSVAIRDYLLERVEEKESKPSAIDLLAESVGL